MLYVPSISVIKAVAINKARFEAVIGVIGRVHS